MNSLRWTKFLILILLAVLLITACGLSDDESIAVSVALTQTAAAQATEAAVTAPESTEIPEATFLGDLQPLSAAECDQLAAFMVNRLPVPPVEQMEVAVEREGETGSGCQAITVGTGEVFPDMMVVEDAMSGILEELGWTEDPTAPVCLGTGGWGPGASSRCYTQADAICELFVYVDPIDDALCSDDEPIFVCFESLAPDQIGYTINLTCARDISAAAAPLDSELLRIEFEPGEIRAAVHGEIPAVASTTTC